MNIPAARTEGHASGKGAYPTEGTDGHDRMGRRVLWSLLTTPLLVGVHLLALLILAVFFVRAGIDYEVLFASWEADLSPTVQLALRLGSWMADYWYLPALAVLFCDGPILFLLGLLPRSWRWMRPFWHNLVLVLLLLILLFGIFAMSLTFRLALDHLRVVVP